MSMLFRRRKKPRYNHYIVENSFAARIDEDTSKAERLLADGKWVPYKDVWDVCTNGRYSPNEKDALRQAKEIFEMRGIEHKLE